MWRSPNVAVGAEASGVANLSGERSNTRKGGSEALTLPHNLVGDELDAHGLAGGDQAGGESETSELTNEGLSAGVVHVVNLDLVVAVLKGEGGELEVDDLVGRGRG